VRLEDLRANIGVMSDEDLMQRVKEIRQNRRVFPEKHRKAAATKSVGTDISKMGEEELIKLLAILEGGEG